MANTTAKRRYNPAMVPKTRSKPHLPSQGTMAYEKPKEMMFLYAMMRLSASGETG
jgi:hypothetical protein